MKFEEPCYAARFDAGGTVHTTYYKCSPCYRSLVHSSHELRTSHTSFPVSQLCTSSMSACSSIVVMRLGSTTAIASISHESMYADMHVALKFYPMYPMPMAFVVIRHYMSSFTHDLPQRALHSLTCVISQPTAAELNHWDMHMTSQLDNNGTSTANDNTTAEGHRTGLSSMPCLHSSLPSDNHSTFTTTRYRSSLIIWRIMGTVLKSVVRGMW